MKTQRVNVLDNTDRAIGISRSVKDKILPVLVYLAVVCGTFGAVETAHIYCKNNVLVMMLVG